MVLTNNFGFFMAGLFRQPVSAVKLQSGFIDENGVPFSANVYKTESGAGLNSVLDNRIQIGKGTTPASRFDLKLETPFTNGGIEDNPVLSGVLSQVDGSGLVTKGTIISPTTGSGSITEVVKCCILDGSRNCIFARNIVNPPANFIGGDSINVSEEIVY